MRLVNCFAKPELSYKGGEESPVKEKVFYNTIRNGFVAAVAMSYNFHLPLILSPDDIWITVLQGLRVHMNQQKEKEFFKLTFKDMDKITKTIESALKINDDGLKDLEKMSSRDIEKKLFKHLDGSFDKVWNQKHCASDFSAGYGADEFRQLIKVDKLSDMF
jgi:hypothetical protein